MRERYSNHSAAFAAAARKGEESVKRGNLVKQVFLRHNDRSSCTEKQQLLLYCIDPTTAALHLDFLRRTSNEQQKQQQQQLDQRGFFGRTTTGAAATLYNRLHT